MIGIYQTKEQSGFALAYVNRTGDRVYVAYDGSANASAAQVKEAAEILSLAAAIAADFDRYYQAN